MAKILLQTTIAEHPDDWDITRFSLLAQELRAAGHEVIARNRVDRADDDPILSHVDPPPGPSVGHPARVRRWRPRAPQRAAASTSPFVRNIATWLQPATGRYTPNDRHGQRVPAHQ